MINRNIFAACVFAATSLASAHLTDGSLVPSGGQTLKTGASLTITWKEDEIHHSRIDISLSKDNGATWTDIRTKGPDESADGSFKWTIPTDAVSAQAKIRVCQSGPCSATQNVTKASGNSSPWYLVSNTFAIQASTAIAAPGASNEGLTVDYRPDLRNVEVTFAMAHEGAVNLAAFDMQGRVVAQLIQDRFAAGEHRLSVFANRLDGAQGLVFKLQAGDRSVSHAWMSVR